MNPRFQASGAPHNEAAENETMMMDRMEGPSDNEAMHQKPRRKHRRRIELADFYKIYGSKRK